MILSAIELKAIRLSLGLTVTEASDECGVTNRTFQYWENGERGIPLEVMEVFSHYITVQSNVSTFMQRGVDAWNAKNPQPYSEDVEEYKRLVKEHPKLALPYFRTLQDFTEATGNPHVFSMRIYNVVVSQYFALGKIHHLLESDKAEIPKEFESVWYWLRGGYDNTSDDED